jgi:hypothetical protein
LTGIAGAVVSVGWGVVENVAIFLAIDGLVWDWRQR